MQLIVEMDFQKDDPKTLMNLLNSFDSVKVIRTDTGDVFIVRGSFTPIEKEKVSNRRGPKHLTDWSKIDWALTSSEIAANLGCGLSTVYYNRKRFAPKEHQC